MMINFILVNLFYSNFDFCSFINLMLIKISFIIMVKIVNFINIEMFEIS